MDRDIAATDRYLLINTDMQLNVAAIASGGDRSIIRMSVGSDGGYVGCIIVSGIITAVGAM